MITMRQITVLILLSAFLLSCNANQEKKTETKAPTASDQSALATISASDLGSVGFDFPGKLSLSPSFKLKDLEGKSVQLADYKGKIVLLNFWATWCGPCQAEMPSMQAFYEKNKASGIVMLAINIGETEDIVRNYMEENAFTFPVLLDEDQQIALDYSIEGIPTTYIVGKDGHFLARLVSSFEWDSEVFFDSLKLVL